MDGWKRTKKNKISVLYLLKISGCTKCDTWY